MFFFKFTYKEGVRQGRREGEEERGDWLDFLRTIAGYLADKRGIVQITNAMAKKEKKKQKTKH